MTPGCPDWFESGVGRRQSLKELAKSGAVAESESAGIVLNFGTLQ